MGRQSSGYTLWLQPMWRAVLKQAGDTGEAPAGILRAQGTAVSPLYCNAESKWPHGWRVPAGQGSSLNGSPPRQLLLWSGRPCHFAGPW